MFSIRQSWTTRAYRVRVTRAIAACNVANFSGWTTRAGSVFIDWSTAVVSPVSRFGVRDDGAVVASPEVWGYLAAKTTQVVLRDLRSGLRADLLQEFVHATSEAAQRQVAPDTAVSSAKPEVAVVATIEITPAEAAERMCCSVQYVRRLCQDGKLMARQVGRQWLIDAAQIDRQSPRRAS
jgi:excisionase family DNA binding protein